jgi:hypothetical protein
MSVNGNLTRHRQDKIEKGDPEDEIICKVKRMHHFTEGRTTTRGSVFRRSKVAWPPRTRHVMLQ